MVKRNNDQTAQTAEIKHNIKVTRVHDWGSNITFDMNVNGVDISGMRVIQFKDKQTGEDKQFFDFPTRPYTDKKSGETKYARICWFKITVEDEKVIDEQINALL